MNMNIKFKDKEETRLMKWIQLAACKDVLKPVMNGIHIKRGEVVACDGARIHKAKAPAILVEGDGKTIKPLHTITISPRLEEFEEIEGKYPDYEAIIKQVEDIEEASAGDGV